MSLPHGRRIAFDPELGRVWRICAKCGEWNLMGPEAAHQAMPELVARFGGAGEVRGLAITTVSSRLEVIRVGTRTELVAGALALADRRRVLDRIGTVPALAMVGLIVVLLGMMVVGGYSPYWGFGAQLLAWGGALRTVAWLRRRKRGLHITARGLGLSVAALMVGALVPWNVHGTYSVTATALRVAGSLLFAVLATAAGNLARHRLPSGRRIAVDRESIEAMDLIWNQQDRVIRVAPFGQDDLDAEDSADVLTNLAEWRGVPGDVLDRAHALVASTDHLDDVVEIVGVTAATGDDRIKLADLPAVYWIALDLAFIRERERNACIGVAQDARSVAAIAESLDRDE